MIRDRVRRQLPELHLNEEEREKQKQIAFLQKQIAEKQVKLGACDMLLPELADGPCNVKLVKTNLIWTVRYALFCGSLVQVNRLDPTFFAKI